MGLGHGKWLSGDSQGRSETYRSILTVRILAVFQHGMMDVWSNSSGVRDIIMIMLGSIWNGHVCGEFGLKAES